MGIPDWTKGPLLQSGLGVVQGLIGQAFARRNWRLANEYNAPAKQMARFKAAGLNPNLIYSQGNAGNTTAIPAPNMGTSTAANVPAAKLAEGQKGLLSSQENLNNANAIKALKDGGLSDARAYEILIMLNPRLDLTDSEINLNKQKLLESQQSVRESEGRVEEINQRINESEQRIYESQERILNLAKSREYIDLQMLGQELQNAYDETRNVYQDVGIAQNKWLQFLYQVAQAGDKTLQEFLIKWVGENNPLSIRNKLTNILNSGAKDAWEFINRPSNEILHPGR